MDYDIIYVIIYYDFGIFHNNNILYTGIGYWIYCYFRRRYHMCYDSNIYHQSVSKEKISSEAGVSNDSCIFFAIFTTALVRKKEKEDVKMAIIVSVLVGCVCYLLLTKGN